MGNSISGQNEADAKTRVAARFWELRSGTFTDVFLTSNNIYSDLNIVIWRSDPTGPGRDIDHTTSYIDAKPFAQTVRLPAGQTCCVVVASDVVWDALLPSAVDASSWSSGCSSGTV